jgi:hypothetical protein
MVLRCRTRWSDNYRRRGIGASTFSSLESSDLSAIAFERRY